MLNIMRFLPRSNVEITMENAIHLDEQGEKKAALHLFIDLVRENPKCKPCRFHMGRLMKEVEAEKASEQTKSHLEGAQNNSVRAKP